MWVVVILSSMAPICVLGLFVILGIMLNVIGFADVIAIADFG